MKKLAILALAAALSGCSTAQLAAINAATDKYDAAINNFNLAVSSINTSIALTSATLANYCSDAEATGKNLEQIVVNNDIALTGLTTVTAGINQWCTAPPQDVGSAIVSLTASIAAGKAAYDKARGG